MNAVQELTSLAESVSNPAIENWKGKGKRVVGFVCTYTPEEILTAADIMPYRLRPVGCTETTSSDVYISRLNCSFVRCCLEYILEDKFAFLDGTVFSNTCDNIRCLYDNWKEIQKDSSFLHFLQIPHKVNEDSIAFFCEEFVKLKEQLEKSFGVEITETKLRNAIEVHNETRRLLRRLYELRQADSPPLTGEETLKIVLAGTVMPKAQYNRLLKEALEELNQRQGISGYKARLMLVGSLYDDPEHMKIIEDLGGLVVTDALCFGSRYFWEPVDLSDDLMSSLARSYMTRPQCARMTDTAADRNAFVGEMIEKYKVDGVIYQRLRYCDPWGCDNFLLGNNLKELGIPMLSLEREYVLGATGQLKTRVQAFLERIGRS